MENDLISRRALFNALFVHNGRLCPNKDIDNFPTTVNVEDIKGAIRNAPTAYYDDIGKIVEKLQTELCLADKEKERCAKKIRCSLMRPKVMHMEYRLRWKLPSLSACLKHLSMW